MRNTKLIFTLLLTVLFGYNSVEAKSRLQLDKEQLMYEMRAKVSPLNGAEIDDRYVSLQWPLRVDDLFLNGKVNNQTASQGQLNAVGKNYQIRISRDASFKGEVSSYYTSWPFYNLPNDIESGTWYWQYGYVNSDETTTWSEVNHFNVVPNSKKFAPPVYSQFIKELPTSHPRILVQKENWNQIIEASKHKPEREWILANAAQIMKQPLVPFDEAINVDLIEGLTDIAQKNQMTIREGRRLVDREESNQNVLIRAYLLTKDERYAEESLSRFKAMLSWKKSPYMKGDFNKSTFLLLASTIYDSYYNLLDEPTKAVLLSEVKENGTAEFDHNANYLENHVAENHIWQMSLRIFTFAAFAVYGDLPEADAWTDYVYNVWRARFPGLNRDGAWHNGDSYYQVNAKTLIEVPYFYSQVSGYDFFSDPWYANNLLYAIYQQPPYSHAGGNGSAHSMLKAINPVRTGYIDALARLLGAGIGTEYVDLVLQKDNKAIQKSFRGKAGDLSWFRIVCNKPLPAPVSLATLPNGHVFSENGLASFMSNWGNLAVNSMLSFRSSPYGSTSHALANQNSFNTFYGGNPLFYSSGHHISFVDHHSLLSDRASRAHNTILVNGTGQKIGIEGYGWIPRHYVGDEISYVLGDASNAYGKVTSQIWLDRAKNAGIEYTKENGWDENKLKTFRRHIVTLGNAEVVFIYDELEATEPVRWDYLLHSIHNTISVDEESNSVIAETQYKGGKSTAYLFTPDKLTTSITDQFFTPATNWLRADDKGNFMKFANHWHFTASSPKQQTYRFATVLITTAVDNTGYKVVSDKKGEIRVGEWTIKANISTKGKPYFKVSNPKTGAKIILDGSTTIKEDKSKVKLVDKLPYLEI